MISVFTKTKIGRMSNFAKTKWQNNKLCKTKVKINFKKKGMTEERNNKKKEQRLHL